MQDRWSFRISPTETSVARFLLFHVAYSQYTYPPFIRDVFQYFGIEAGASKFSVKADNLYGVAVQGADVSKLTGRVSLAHPISYSQNKRAILQSQVRIFLAPTVYVSGC